MPFCHWWAACTYQVCAPNYQASFSFKPSFEMVNRKKTLCIKTFLNLGLGTNGTTDLVYHSSLKSLCVLQCVYVQTWHMQYKAEFISKMLVVYNGECWTVDVSINTQQCRGSDSWSCRASADNLRNFSWKRRHSWGSILLLIYIGESLMTSKTKMHMRKSSATS